MKEYEAEQLHEVNAQLAEVLISKLSAFLGEMQLIRDKYKLEGNLQQNELLKKDMQKNVGYVTPYIPLVGLISAGMTVGAHVVDKAMFDIPGKEFPVSKETKKTTVPEQNQADQEEVPPKTK